MQLYFQKQSILLTKKLKRKSFPANERVVAVQQRFRQIIVSFLPQYYLFNTTYIYTTWINFCQSFLIFDPQQTFFSHFTLKKFSQFSSFLLNFYHVQRWLAFGLTKKGLTLIKVKCRFNSINLGSLGFRKQLEKLIVNIA